MQPVLVLSSGLMAAALAMWFLHALESKSMLRDTTSNSKKRRRTKTPLAYHRGMTEKEYTALIPQPELQQIEAFLAQVYCARGWSTQSLFCQSAWQTVFEQAIFHPTDPWDEQFTVSSMQPDRLNMLSDLLDQTFLGGQLQAWLRQQNKQPLRFQPLSQSVGPDDWYANFFPQQNTVALKRSRWAEDALVVSYQRPADYEGIQCTCRLQVLLHTMAHEMVHALVYHRFPNLDSHSLAYTVDDRHGPIFRLLNLKLFGHATEDFKIHRR